MKRMTFDEFVEVSDGPVDYHDYYKHIIKELESKLADYNERWKERYLVDNPMKGYFLKLESENKKMREALKFYGDESVYETDYCYEKGDQTPILLDGGARARAVSKEKHETRDL